MLITFSLFVDIFNSVFKKPSAASRLNAACQELCDDVTPGSDVTSNDVTKSTNHQAKTRLTSDVTDGRVNTNKWENDAPKRSNDVTMREDDVGRGVGDVTRLGGDVTRSGGDVTRPGGDVTRPVGDVTRLGGDVTRPGGDVTRLGGDVTKPGGDSTLGPPEKPRPSLLRFGEDSEDDDDDDDMPCSPIIPVQTSRLKVKSCYNYSFWRKNKKITCQHLRCSFRSREQHFMHLIDVKKPPGMFYTGFA